MPVATPNPAQWGAKAKEQGQVVSAPRFYVDVPTLGGRIAFSELMGITSKVDSTEYIYNDDKGHTFHTKQYGKTSPPVVSLKRGLDAHGSGALLAWHEMARLGAPNARAPYVTLTVMDASGDAVQIQYLLHEAWCSEIVIASMKAGDSGVATIECKITCERIECPGVTTS